MTLSKIAKTLGLGAAILALSAGAALAATATASVNVRTGPGTSYRAIDTLSPGQRVNVTDQTGGWCEINQSGPDGWVSCRYLTADNSYRGYNDDRPGVSIQLGFGNRYPDRVRPRPHHWNGYPGYYSDGNSYPNYGSSFGFSFNN